MISTKFARVSALIVMVLVSTFFASCDKDTLIVKFNMEYGDLPLYGVSDTVGGTNSFMLPVNSTLEAELQKNGAQKDQIKSIKIKESTFTIDSPTTANFDFLTSIFEFIGKDSLNLVLTAQKDVIPQGVNTFALELKDNDIKDALLQDKFYLEVRASRKSSQNMLMKMRAKLKFEVVAEVPIK